MIFVAPRQAEFVLLWVEAEGMISCPSLLYELNRQMIIYCTGMALERSEISNDLRDKFGI